jgi:hypothetical protein
LALSCSARASLRYRIARALLMASQIPKQRNKDFRLRQQRRLEAFRKHSPSLTGAKSGAKRNVAREGAAAQMPRAFSLHFGENIFHDPSP